MNKNIFSLCAISLTLLFFFWGFSNCSGITGLFAGESASGRPALRPQGDPPVVAARAVLKKVTEKHPTILLDLAVDTSKLIAQKYPMLPYDLLTWRSAGETPEATMQVISKQYPTFKEDHDAIARKGNYPAKFEKIKASVTAMLKKKHPALTAGIQQEVKAVIDAKYPELPGRLAAIAQDTTTDPRLASVKLICSEYPNLVPEVLENVREKHGTELHRAIIDTLAVIEEKHSGVMTGFRIDMMEMMDEKYPALPFDLRERRLENARKMAKLFNEKYPNFAKDFEKMLKKNYPTLGSEIREALESLPRPEMGGPGGPGGPPPGFGGPPPGFGGPPPGAGPMDGPGFGPSGPGGPGGPGFVPEIATDEEFDENPARAKVVKTLMLWDEIDNLGRLFQLGGKPPMARQ